MPFSSSHWAQTLHVGWSLGGPGPLTNVEPRLRPWEMLPRENHAMGAFLLAVLFLLLLVHQLLECTRRTLHTRWWGHHLWGVAQHAPLSQGVWSHRCIGAARWVGHRRWPVRQRKAVADREVRYPVEERVGMAFKPRAAMPEEPEQMKSSPWQVQTDEPRGAMRSPSRQRRQWQVRGGFAGGRNWLFTARPGMDWQGFHRCAAQMTDTGPDCFEVIYQGQVVVPHEMVPGDCDRVELRWRNQPEYPENGPRRGRRRPRPRTPSEDSSVIEPDTIYFHYLSLPQLDVGGFQFISQTLPKTIGTRSVLRWWKGFS